MVNLSTLNNEADRIAALYVLEILSIDEEAAFDNILKLATIITGSSLAAVVFVDEKSIWYNAKLNTVTNVHGKENYPDASYPYSVAIPIVVTDLVIGQFSVASENFLRLTETQYEALELLGQQIITLLQMKLPIINNNTKEFYENILNNIPSEIVAFDADHRYLFANRAAVKNDEVRKYIIGKDDFEYSAYRNRDPIIAAQRRMRFTEVRNSCKSVSWEEILKDQEGNMLTYLRRMLPVYDENGIFMMAIGLGIDITERKLLEEKQTLIMKQLSLQNTQLLDFCNVVSHNLRGPLINMSMLVEFIQETESLEEQKMLISKLEPVIESLKCTFNELVASVQVRQDTDIKSDELLFDVCLQETLDVLHAEIKKTNAKIQMDFQEAPLVTYPHKYLMNIFYNLMSNAIKYQSPERQLLLKVSSRMADGNVILTLQDNGLGIDMIKHKDSIFKIGKIFHRHPDAKGLGLFMTKTQVDAMGGKIWVESCPDQGATFSVEFVNQKKCR